MTGLDWGGAAAGVLVGDGLGVDPFGVVPFVVGAGGPAGTMPGRLWRGCGSGAGTAVEGAGGGDGARKAGGAVVVVGDGGAVVPVGLAGTVLAGAVDGGAVLEVDGVEVDRVGGGGQALPPVTVTSLRVRFTLAAHAHKLHDPLPCPTMVAPLPLIVMGLVTTGKPLAPVLVPSMATA
jgi:hypothetical protein